MADKIRFTSHNSRSGKHGVFSPKHNDRNFDLTKADHIDSTRSEKNYYWHCYQKYYPEMTFEEAEKRVYEYCFRDALDAKNARRIAARHPERVQTMDDYRCSARSCPEETILQIGKAGHTVSPNKLWRIVREQLDWERQTFPCCKLVSLALHMDEQGAPHIHVRKIWVAHDDEGRAIVGQSKALKEMGIERPDPTRPTGKYNNAKQVYTRKVREHLTEVCQKHGLDVEVEPLDHSKTGLALEEYKARKEQERAEQARQDARKAEQERQEALRARDAARGDKEVVEALQTLQKAVCGPLSASVDILAEKPAKVSFTGKETPATVTIAREDLENLQDRAITNERILRASKHIDESVKRIEASAREIHQNRIDAFDVTKTEITAELSAQVADLRRELTRTRKALESTRSDLKQERAWSAKQSDRLKQAKSRADTLDRLEDSFPDLISSLQKIDRLEQDYDRTKSLSRDTLKRYASLCADVGVETRDDIQEAIDHPAQDHEWSLSR